MTMERLVGEDQLVFPSVSVKDNNNISSHTRVQRKFLKSTSERPSGAVSFPKSLSDRCPFVMGTSRDCLPLPSPVAGSQLLILSCQVWTGFRDRLWSPRKLVGKDWGWGWGSQMESWSPGVMGLPSWIWEWRESPEKSIW